MSCLVKRIKNHLMTSIRGGNGLCCCLSKGYEMNCLHVLAITVFKICDKRNIHQISSKVRVLHMVSHEEK